jgi:hypothetical protein
MNTVYLHLTSSYRDRTRYPNPADFSVGINSESKAVEINVNNKTDDCDRNTVISCVDSNSNNTLDPVTTAFPIYIFNVQSIGNSCSTTNFSTGSTRINPILGPIVIPGCDGYSDLADWYQSYFIHDITIDDYKQIMSLDTSTLTATMLLPFPFTFNSTDAYSLIDITYFNKPSSIYGNQFEINKVNLQSFDLFRRDTPFIDNYYTGNIIYNYNTGESNLITAYDYLTHTVTTKNLFNDGISINSIGLPGQEIGDLIAIRSALPIYSQKGRIIDLLPPNQVQINPGGSKSQYIGQFFFMTPLYIDPILQYPYGFSGPSATNTSINDKITKYLFKITDYDEVTGILTLDDIFDTSNYSLFDFNNRWFEILPFTRDNYEPINYSGSMVSITMAVCYEIELISLILPNRELKSGGLPSFLNYVYVEISNVTSAERNAPNTIYSNNPNSNKAVFICPIRDIRNPLISSFVKINSGGMRQTIKFRPNDVLHFKVYLPNGELFITKMDESPSYTQVNQLIQISATFSIKRL